MASLMKRVLKHLIQYNILDYFTPRLRKFYRKLGIQKEMNHAAYWMCHRIVRYLFFKKVWKATIVGAENIPKGGAAVVVSNHSHVMDPLFISATFPRIVNWVSKIENYYTPFFRTFLQIGGSIPIRRGQSDTNALRLMRQTIEEKRVLGIFPEGTRTRTGYINRFHTGAARMCLEYNIPYIPVGIEGSFKLKIGGHITIKIGTPVYPHGKPSNFENTKQLTAQMKQDILQLSNGTIADEKLLKYAKSSAVVIPKGNSIFDQIVRSQMIAAANVNKEI